jgi:hypothetical protein
VTKRIVRLAFTDFWGGFDPRSNYFTDLLAPRYEIEISDRPEYVIYSLFGRRFLDFDCPRICYVGEPRHPNFFECDYALSFDYPHLGHGGRNYRLPHYALYGDAARLIRPEDYDPAAVLAQKTKFCNFVYRRSEALPGHERRIRLFERLSRYKRVDAGGALLNSVGGPVADKIAFIRDYKFTIAFENTVQRGYVSEKLYEPLLAGSLPIYWGHRFVERDFNPGSFIDARRFANLDAVVDHVVALDTDDSLYLEYMRRPPLPGNRVDEAMAPKTVLKWFDGIFERPQPVRGRHNALAFTTTAMRKAERELAGRWQLLRLRLGDDNLRY